MEKVKVYGIKLRLLGIPRVEGPSYILCDNQSVVKSTTRVESTLSKKHNSICWHSIRQAIAHGWLNILWEPTNSNLADLLTKALETEKRNNFLHIIYQQTFYLKQLSGSTEGKAKED